VDYGDEELLAICVVRNGALHIRSFLDHHFALGVRHIVLLDNGSSDETIPIASEYQCVTILRTDCPYSLYENVMKRYLARRFSPGRWNLCVDVDELFDYPYSDQLPLTSLLRYLNTSGYTAVVAQMLDMFSDEPLATLRSSPSDDLRARNPYFDVSAIRKQDYPYGELSNPDVKFHWDGIRKAVFGTDLGLTKAALVKVDDAIELFVNGHHFWHARVADFTCVLLHFPFVGTFAAKVTDAVATGRYGGITTPVYEGYWAGLRDGVGSRSFRGPTAHRLGPIDSLLDDGFLVAGEGFRRWVRAAGGP